MQYTLHYRKAGELSPALFLLAMAWHELEELQCRSLADYLDDSLAASSALERFEAIAWDGGEIVGFAMYVEDLDVHVGRCLSIGHHYVLPSHRQRGCAKHFMRWHNMLAAALRIDVCAWTHRKGPWRYSTTYRSSTWARQSRNL